MVEEGDGTTPAGGVEGGPGAGEGAARRDPAAPAEGLARLLAHLGDAPVPTDALRAALGAAADPAIEEAVRRSWARRAGGGVRRAAGLPARFRAPDRAAAAAAGRLLETAVPADPEDPAAAAVFRALRPHALPALEAARAAGLPLDPALFGVARIGAQALAEGDPEAAAELFGGALERAGGGAVPRAGGGGARRARGAPARAGGAPEEPFLAALLAEQLATALQDLGREAEAREAARRAEAAARAACAPGDPRLAALQVNVGTIYKRQGDWPTAEVHFRRALDGAGAAGEAAAPLLGAIRLNLCDVLRAQGRPAEARTFAERALRESERALGPMHRGTADAAETLALVLEELGEPQAAVPLWRRVAALYERHLGPEHPIARAAARRAAGRGGGSHETRGGASP